MDQIIGAGVTLGIGVIIIAAIYQLAKPGGQTLTNAVIGPQGAYQSTLNSLFK